MGVGVGVRRLTPTECERLQALPDGWTDHGPDSRRYSALGDAVTASVARWIGERLLAADARTTHAGSDIAPSASHSMYFVAVENSDTPAAPPLHARIQSCW